MSRIAFLAVTTSMFAGPIFAVDDLHTIEEPISFQNGKQGIFHRLDDWLENGNPARVADPNSISSRIRNNLRMTIDLSGRSVLSQRAGKSASGSVVFLGIDVHKVFSDEEGDWASLLAQPYLTKLNNVRGPHFFDDDNDWEMVYRITNINFTRLFGKHMNLKVGHFEVPYGLELPINTNGTLRDMASGKNLGVKADWGVTLNGAFTDFEYEFSISRGSGNEYFDTESPYAIAGRIGSNEDRNVMVGVSFFHGEIWNPGALAGYKAGLVDASGVIGNVIDRQRFGFDLRYHFEKPVTILAEFNWGRDFERKVFNSLLEFDVYNPSRSLMWFSQFNYLSEEYESAMGGWQSFINGSLGCRWNPGNNWALSTMFIQELSTKHPADAVKRLGGVFFTQVRYRF
ncbi:hypothetical protein OAG56_02290 [Mariniblastus sp.]|nr:hypothetical protein [Mariniblastus sp.]MDB4670815.1 hypothetical protein [Pirellulaceae bacterium]MDB4756175.1 hypothetical protein [Mariniblastus sp.]